jgi:3-oxoacyl-(acyl-carrier-protein) synthase
MGVCAPNGTGLDAFAHALREGRSGIRFHPELEILNFGCQIAGSPLLNDDLINNYFTPLQLKGLLSNGLIYGVIAGTDAWKDAGLETEAEGPPDWDSGIMFGTGLLGVDKFRESVYHVDAGQVRKLGSNSVMQTMASGISAFLGGMLGCGNQVSTNSSACSTGTEAVLMGWERIRGGQAERMLVGSCSDSGPYIWGGFDAMRILPRTYNADPAAASRPMSATASGFVPGSGAGALLLESLESARERGARIYAEVLGGAINCGGQRNGGSMTAPNSNAVQRCIRQALMKAGVRPTELDSINGHLTATSRDAEEIENWSEALGRSGEDFPMVNSFKSTLGHCLAAAGSIECVGAVLQFRKGEVFGNINCEDLHPGIAARISPEKVPLKSLSHPLQILAKASFGFGDVNACVIFKRYSN